MTASTVRADAPVSMALATLSAVLLCAGAFSLARRVVEPDSEGAFAA